jgi:hypothetical protein
LKQTYRRDRFEAFLNQTTNLNAFSDGKLEDDLIAVTLRTLIELYVLLNQSVEAYSRMRNEQIPPRYITYLGVQAQGTAVAEETRSALISQIFRLLTLNPQGIQLQKTVCSLIIISIEKKQKLRVS